MFGEPKGGGRDLEALKRRYDEGQRRIEDAVKKGELSREDADKKLIELRKAIFADTKAKKRTED